MKIVDFPTEIEGVRVVESEEEVLEALKNGESVCRYEWGDSMHPVLKNGEYGVISPINDISEIQRGDAVFCKMPEGYYMTHMVWEISRSGYGDRPWFKIGSTMGTIFGWTQDVLGFVKGTDCCQRYTREYREELRKKFLEN